MASIEQTQRSCKSCGTNVLAQRKGCNHIVHALVTLFLFGLWIPIWIFAAMTKGSWRCQKCGEKC
jgi:hypothetical protein